MIRLGIVDFDSSHSIEFTRRLNHVGVDRDQRVDGARVVLGCPGTSVMSPNRIAGFQHEIEACGVGLVDAPTDMLGQVDAVLVLSVQGAAHLPGARPFLEAGVPTFVDKPFATSLADAETMFDLAEQSGTLIFGSSAMRYCEEVDRVRRRLGETLGELRGCHVHGPSKRDPGNPGLFHYGIHAVEMLFALVGPGCESVSCRYNDDGDLVTARWSDGRQAVLRGLVRGATPYGFTAYTDRGVITEAASSRYAYRNLLRAIVTGFESRDPIVPRTTTLEITRFVLAALDSERRGGIEIDLNAIRSSADTETARTETAHTVSGDVP